MKNYLVTIRIADGSNYETTVEQYSLTTASQKAELMMLQGELESGEIICILLSE